MVKDVTIGKWVKVEQRKRRRSERRRKRGRKRRRRRSGLNTLQRMIR